MVIVKSVQSGKFYLVEYTKSSFIYTAINEDFALQSSLPLLNYEGNWFVWNFHNFVMNNKPV